MIDDEGEIVSYIFTNLKTCKTLIHRLLMENVLYMYDTFYGAVMCSMPLLVVMLKINCETNDKTLMQN